MTCEEIQKYRQFLYDHFDLKLSINMTGPGHVYGYPSIAADLYNALAKMHAEKYKGKP